MALLDLYVGITEPYVAQTRSVAKSLLTHVSLRLTQSNATELPYLIKLISPCIYRYIYMYIYVL